MSKVSDIWLSRIGPQATRTLERAVLLNRCGIAGIFLMIPVFWVFNVAHSNVGMGAAFIGLLVWPIVCFSWAGYLQTQSRKQAGDHLNLSAGEWRWLSVRSTERFDEWVSQHQN